MPLGVSIDSISPAVIPDDGPITVSGEVVNQSDDPWTDLNVYLLTSTEPFTTGADVAEAQRTDPATEIGARLTERGLYASIGDLQPGSSVDFSMTVEREDLQVTGEEGVYWLGVHVLGATDEGRIAGADGRARTFIPLMRDEGPSTRMALTIPLKAGVRRDAQGRLQNVRTLTELLRADGRLARVLRLSGTSLDFPLTWVVDPAVVDAARWIAQGNPAWDFSPTDEDSEGSQDGGPSTLDSDGARAARWLATFRRQADQHTVLYVPYGDLDVASALRHGFDELFDQALELSEATLDGIGVAADPAIVPPTGLLPRDVLSKLGPGTPVMLSERALPSATQPVLETDRGVSVVLADSAVASGGPSPTPPFRALSLRQRILSEAAVHALSDQSDQPLVVSAPQLWNPGGDWRLADFFAGLEQPWLQPVPLPSVTSAEDPGRPAKDARGRVELRYPPSEAAAEVPVANLAASDDLDLVGEAFANLLTRNDTVDESIAKSAMLGSTYRARWQPLAALARTREATTRLRTLMNRVRIEGPSFVTMSSGEGTFAITVVNDLDEPVTVGVEVRTGSDELRITTPDPVSLGPGQRSSVRLRATSEDVGLHSVTLVPTNSDGRAVGSPATFNVRSSQVGLVIWLIMGLGATVLFAASGYRIAQRLRSRKSTAAVQPAVASK